jgi:hypothetical protein
MTYQAEDSVRRGALLPILTEWSPPPSPVHMVHAARQHPPLKLRAFLDFAAPRLQQRLRAVADVFDAGEKARPAAPRADTAIAERRSQERLSYPPTERRNTSCASPYWRASSFSNPSGAAISAPPASSTTHSAPSRSQPPARAEASAFSASPLP